MRAAEIKGYADFSGAAWPDAMADQQGAFEGCRFRDVADFKTDGFAAFALFDGAEFKGRLLLTDPGEAQSDRLFDRALQAAQEATETDKKRRHTFEQERSAHAEALRRWEAQPEDLRGDKPKAPDDPAADTESGADARFGALVSGLRTLRLAMAAQSDLARAQRFYRYEVKARARMPSEPRAARLAAWLYRVSSDYGMSIGRPIFVFGCILLVFASLAHAGSLGLEAWSGAPKPCHSTSLTRDERIWHALGFSMSNSFRPLSALAPEGPDGNPLARRLLNDCGAGWGVAVRFLAVLQSLSAVALAFLFGLALRRRFQIA